MNFHRSRYKYSGLGRHCFGDSSSPSDVSLHDYSSGTLLSQTSHVLCMQARVFTLKKGEYILIESCNSLRISNVSWKTLSLSLLRACIFPFFPVLHLLRSFG